MNNAFLIKYLSLACAFVVTCIVAHHAASTTTPPGARTGIRGLARQRALKSGDSWSYVEPLVRWLGAALRGAIPRKLASNLDQQILLSGGYLGLHAEDFVALSVLATIAGVVASWTLNAILHVGSLFLVLTTSFSALAPWLSMSSNAAMRSKAISRRLPSAIDLLSLAMTAGLDFPNSVRQVVEKSGASADPLIEEFGLILQSLQLGRTRRQALEEFASRCPITCVSEFTGSVIQGELHGHPLAHVLRIQAEVSRQQRSVRAEEAAAKASVGMILPLVLVFVAVLALIAGPIMLHVHDSGF